MGCRSTHAQKQTTKPGRFRTCDASFQMRGARSSASASKLVSQILQARLFKFLESTNCYNNEIFFPSLSLTSEVLMYGVALWTKFVKRISCQETHYFIYLLIYSYIHICLDSVITANFILISPLLLCFILNFELTVVGHIWGRLSSTEIQTSVILLPAQKQRINSF